MVDVDRSRSAGKAIAEFLRDDLSMTAFHIGTGAHEATNLLPLLDELPQQIESSLGRPMASPRLQVLPKDRHRGISFLRIPQLHQPDVLNALLRHQ